VKKVTLNAICLLCNVYYYLLSNANVCFRRHYTERLRKEAHEASVAVLKQPESSRYDV